MGERNELLGRLIDVMEDWLTAKGIAKKDEAFITGDDYDFLVGSFSKIIYGEERRNEYDERITEIPRSD